ncbi:MAG TPA: hypothetical protein VK739_04710 [bacterium]|nr:hypothetical protein [bacterium]
MPETLAPPAWCMVCARPPCGHNVDETGATPSVVPRHQSLRRASGRGASQGAALPESYSRGCAIFRKLIQAQQAASATDLNGTIEGRIGLVGADGKTIPCAGASVYLLLQPIDIDAIKQKAVKDGAFNPRMAHIAVGYVIASHETQSKLAYAKTKTNAKGQFLFSNLPGDRWYYVTAQALTEQELVSWQIGVFVYPKERVQVFLHNANAALPIYKRE